MSDFQYVCLFINELHFTLPSSLIEFNKKKHFWIPVDLVWGTGPLGDTEVTKMQPLLLRGWPHWEIDMWAALTENGNEVGPGQGHGCHAWRTEEGGFCSDGGRSEKVWWERRSWSPRLKRNKRWSGEGTGSANNKRSGPSSSWATLSMFRCPFVISSHPPTPTLIIKTILCSFPPALEKSVSRTQLYYSETQLTIYWVGQKVHLGFSISSYELFGQPNTTVFYLVLCYLDAVRKQRN